MAFDVTSEQKAQYEADGYFIARKLLAADEVQFLRRQITDVIAHGQNGLNFDNTRRDGRPSRAAACTANWPCWADAIPTCGGLITPTRT